MNSFFVMADAVLCGLVILAALEFLRVVHAFEHPVLCVAFNLVALGAFGILFEIARGVQPTSGSVLLHLGVVLYAWARRKHIFQHDWHWDGVDRRKHG